MGCHGSKQARSPCPLPRSKSLPEHGHVVFLTSSTLGSLNLDKEEQEVKEQSSCDDESKKMDISVELVNARAWSDMIDRKIPRTPTETPPNEPEAIDALELMAGFHGDYSPLDRRSFSFHPKGEEAKKSNVVVFYFTTLRGIRKTYDDSCTVKAILREYSVRIDERDTSMHSQFKEELKKMSRDGMCLLPRVLVDGKDLGGAEEVKRMHETGELAKLFGKYGDGLRGEECETCGDVRFVLCGHCSGSCRVYANYEEEEEEEEEGGGGWRRCSDCNENGIVRCPVCC